MQLKRMRVTNFSSFKDSGWIEFSPGINLIVGQNNSGKSALLHGFEQELQDNRHRDQTEYRRERLEPPSIYFVIDVSGQEVNDSILSVGKMFYWPTETDNSDDEWRKISQYLSEPSHIVELCRRPANTPITWHNPTHGQFEGPIQFCLGLSIVNGRIINRNIVSANADTFPSAMYHLLLEKMFSFSAQRYSIGKHPFGREDKLKSDASNLAAILSRLQGEQRSLFDRLVGHLREVFSTVRNLSVAPIQEGFEIRVWPTDEQLQPELSFGLDDCGTGVAQVIAILTIVMTFEGAVIIIDEISSFLHPAATKALLRIIQTNYAQHQYIISTHSPEVLSAGNPATVHVIRRDGYDSVVTRVDLGELDQLRDVVDDLGISITDVFGAERIIWVEGRTEELCFPYIYEVTTGQQLPRGLIVTRVIATGDFNAKRRRDLVFQIYQRVHHAASPLVRSITFGFDRETLNDKQMQALKDKAAGRVLFLPRRLFECYLLEPAAIAAFINNQIPDLAKSVLAEDVITHIRSVGGEVKFKAPKQWNGDVFNEQWLAEVDAAELLKEICYQLTENRLSFSKTRHSLELLQHIMAHNRTSLDGLINYVKELFVLAQGNANGVEVFSLSKLERVLGRSLNFSGSRPSPSYQALQNVETPLHQRDEFAFRFGSEKWRLLFTARNMPGAVAFIAL